ncbi:hypothetical protein ACFE04_024840 [Oxalis oulophora]
MKTRWLSSVTRFTGEKSIVPNSPPPPVPPSDNATSSLSSFPLSLQSNLSLQTLPSVPSLSSLSPDSTTTISISHTPITIITPTHNNSPITCLAVFNNHLLYAACGHQIYVYDRATCTQLDTFNVQDSSTGSVKSVLFSNNKVFTAHQDCKIRVSQLTANKRHKLLSVLPTINDRLRHVILPKSYVTVRRHKKKLWIEHSDAITALAVNNGLVYSVSWDKSLKIWRASDLRCLESVKAHNDAVNAVVVSSNGTVYTGSGDRTIRVWTKPVNEKRARHVLVASLEKHKSSVNALTLNEDGSVLFSGACDRSILVWEREDSANHMVVTGALRGHKSAILCLVYVNGHDLLISGSADRTVRIWQRGGADGKFSCLAVLEGHTKAVKSLFAVSEEEEEEENGVVSIYSGSLDGEIRLWRVTVSKPGCVKQC